MINGKTDSVKNMRVMEVKKKKKLPSQYIV